MAAPRYRLRAHDRNLLFSRHLYKLFDSLSELRGLHIIGVAAKACVAPAGIQRIRFCVAQSSQGSQMRIVDAGGLQGFGQRLAIELRVGSGARNGAYVHQRSTPWALSIAMK